MSHCGVNWFHGDSSPPPLLSPTSHLFPGESDHVQRSVHEASRHCLRSVLREDGVVHAVVSRHVLRKRRKQENRFELDGHVQRETRSFDRYKCKTWKGQMIAHLRASISIKHFIKMKKTPSKSSNLSLQLFFFFTSIALRKQIKTRSLVFLRASSCEPISPEVWRAWTQTLLYRPAPKCSSSHVS